MKPVLARLHRDGSVEVLATLDNLVDAYRDVLQAAGERNLTGSSPAAAASTLGQAEADSISR